MTPNKQKLLERLLSGSDDLFTSFVIAGLEESLEIICDWMKLHLSMDKIPDHLMDNLIDLRADGEATIRILRYYGAGDYPVAVDLMAKAHVRIHAWECYLRATEQPDMSQEDDTDVQPIPALKDAQERTKGMLTEDDAEMSKHFVEMADRIEELEDKLAKAMKTLSCYAGHWADDKTFIRTDDGGELAGETIAELTGDDDG